MNRKMIFLIAVVLFFAIFVLFSCKNSDKQKKEFAIKENKIYKTQVCSYCGEKLNGFLVLSQGKKDILICDECLVLTFDLMLGREND